MIGAKEIETKCDDHVELKFESTVIFIFLPLRGSKILSKDRNIPKTKVALTATRYRYRAKLACYFQALLSSKNTTKLRGVRNIVEWSTLCLVSRKGKEIWTPLRASYVTVIVNVANSWQTFLFQNHLHYSRAVYLFRCSICFSVWTGELNYLKQKENQLVR